MDDATVRSLRRYREKHRPPRTPEENLAYQTHRARVKLHRVIRAILRDYFATSPLIGRRDGSGWGMQYPDDRTRTEFHVTCGWCDDRRLRVMYQEPPALRVFYRAPVDDPIRVEWDAVTEQLRDQTNIPIEVNDESMPTAEEKAALAAETANLEVVFKRRPRRM